MRSISDFVTSSFSFSYFSILRITYDIATYIMPFRSPLSHTSAIYARLSTEGLSMRTR